MGNMNICIRTAPKYEYSYNLANLRENWAHKKKSWGGKCALCSPPLGSATEYNGKHLQHSLLLAFLHMHATY